MKQPIQLYVCLIVFAFLLSPAIQAQTESKSKSRLELGKKPTASTRLIHSKNFPFLKHPSVAGLDRSVTFRKHAAINDYYRSLLISSSSTRTPARSVATDQSNLAIIENRQHATEDTRKPDEKMFANDRITVSNIYPNPAYDTDAEIDYQITGPIGEAKLLIYNVLGGDSVGEYKLDINERKVRIMTRSLNTGVYFYQLSLDGKKVATKKLLVRHQ